MRIKKVIREQLKAEREIEKAKKDAEREEKRCLEALAQAHVKAEPTSPSIK